MLTCPHCGQPGVSRLRKAFLGPSPFPAGSTTCGFCGKKVGVPLWSVVTAVPFVIAILGATRTSSGNIKVALWVLGFLIMAVIHVLWVPLERR